LTNKIEISAMVEDVVTDNAIMFEPVGEGVEVPKFFRRGKDVYMLICIDPDGRASYIVR